MPPHLTPPSDVHSPDGAVHLNDFYYVSGADQFLYVPTGDLWKMQAINGRLPLVPTGKKRNGKLVYVKPSAWLKLFRAIEQMTWAPGEPEIIEDRLLGTDGWRVRPGAHALNLYQPPTLALGDAAQATPWVEHLNRLYPEEASEITDWLAQRLQYPGVKINYALGLGGSQGIGKDTLLEPLKRAVGPGNFQEIAPTDLMGSYNPFARAVILRMNEAHDLGDSGRADRYALYERVKSYATAPPDVLACVDKYIRRFYVPNMVGLIITTNHKTDGVYLPADDRRHLMAWSNCVKEEFTAEYFNTLWSWLQHDGGNGHVAAYLLQRDLSDFNPCALPKQTNAFFDIVNASQAPEDAEIADALDELKRPDICTLAMIVGTQCGASLEWLLDRRRRRSIPYRMERCDYVACRNPHTKDGLWRINGRRQTLYAQVNLAPDQQLAAALDFMAKLNGNHQ